MGEESEPRAVVDASRAQLELGLSLTPPCETLRDMAATLVQLGLAQPKPKQRAS